MAVLPAPVYSPVVIPRFVVFEGVDAAGSTTQARLLVEGLCARGHRAVLQSEPTDAPIGRILRDVMRGHIIAADNRADTERQLAYLFAADRHWHLYNPRDGILRLTAAGTIVVSTRYHFSSFAYNARNAEGFDLVQRLNRDFPLPEVVCYMTCPIEVSLARLSQRAELEFYELEDEQRRVREAYRRVFSPIADRVLEFESAGSPEETAAAVIAAVLPRLTPAPGA
jgi:dTMP kinase